MGNNIKKEAERLIKRFEKGASQSCECGRFGDYISKSTAIQCAIISSGEILNELQKSKIQKPDVEYDEELEMWFNIEEYLLKK